MRSLNLELTGVDYNVNIWAGGDSDVLALEIDSMGA